MADIDTNRAMNDDKILLIIFWRQLSQSEIAPIWRLQKYVHFKYILWHFEYMS